MPNPNGGGVAVPISSWQNANDDCPIDPPVDPSGGSWSTCERHEWYGTDIMPDDFKCPTANCSCATDEKRISYSEQGDQYVGIDIVTDEDFPCDLWLYMFGLPKYEVDGVTINDETVDFVKYGLAQEVLDDCSSLDETSQGVYWVSGNTCSVNANTQIGTAEHPVFLISAASTTRFAGGANLFGTLMVTDVEHVSAKFDAVGTTTIYRAAVVDAQLAKYQVNPTPWDVQITYEKGIVITVPAFGQVDLTMGQFEDYRPNTPGAEAVYEILDTEGVFLFDTA